MSLSSTASISDSGVASTNIGTTEEDDDEEADEEEAEEEEEPDEEEAEEDFNTPKWSKFASVEVDDADADADADAADFDANEFIRFIYISIPLACWPIISANACFWLSRGLQKGRYMSIWSIL